MPFSVTDVANILAAIANRNDTTAKIVGTPAGSESTVNVVHLEIFTVAALLGRDVAFNYHEALKNPATQMYFSKLNDKLYSVGMHLSRGMHFWVLSKIPRNDECDMDVSAMYCLGDMFRQSPHGLMLGLTPVEQGAPSEHSVKTHTNYVTATLRK